MKNTIIALFTVFAISLQLSVLADNPPPPNNGNGNPGGGNIPVGGGAPVAEGFYILLAMSALYGSTKYIWKKAEELK